MVTQLEEDVLVTTLNAREIVLRVVDAPKTRSTERQIDRFGFLGQLVVGVGDGTTQLECVEDEDVVALRREGVDGRLDDALSPRGVSVAKLGVGAQSGRRLPWSRTGRFDARQVPAARACQLSVSLHS